MYVVTFLPFIVVSVNIGRLNKWCPWAPLSAKLLAHLLNLRLNGQFKEKHHNDHRIICTINYEFRLICVSLINLMKILSPSSKRSLTVNRSVYINISATSLLEFDCTYHWSSDIQKIEITCHFIIVIEVHMRRIQESNAFVFFQT